MSCQNTRVPSGAGAAIVTMFWAGTGDRKQAQAHTAGNVTLPGDVGWFPDIASTLYFVVWPNSTFSQASRLLALASVLEQNARYAP